jgi:GMP synthase-like glutamine amidotransferase
MILIIQNGFISSCMSRYFDIPYEIKKSFTEDVSFVNLDKYSMVIILGGYQSAARLHENLYLLSVIKLIHRCCKIKKPLIGICLGCQLIASALGCKLKSFNKLNIGFDVDIFDYTNIFRSHIDYIDKDNVKNINVIQYFNDIPYYFEYNDHVVGIQCHPDITPECMINYTNDEKSLKYALENSETINKQNKEIFDKMIAYVLKK